MVTRCKFKCESKTLHAGDVQSVTFHAVTNGSEENKSFWKWTPAGVLTVQSINPNVDFTPGKEYYLDITLAE